MEKIFQFFSELFGNQKFLNLILGLIKGLFDTETGMGEETEPTEAETV